MLKDFLGFRQKKAKPGILVKETHAKLVPSERFNSMIDYYTAELKSRLGEIKQLKEENEMLIKTSLRTASHADEYRLHLKKLEEEVRVLRERREERS